MDNATERLNIAMSLLQYQDIRDTAGDAVGKITGINHLQLVVRDMDEAVKFYRDLLGLKVVRTMGKEALDRITPTPVTKNYFFELGNGEMVTLIEVKGSGEPVRSVWDLWPDRLRPARPFRNGPPGIERRQPVDLEWFMHHLREHGVAVTDILGRERFVQSIYFTDPTGNPLEIATFDWENEAWSEHKAEDWYVDTQPVESLLRPGGPPGRPTG